MPPKRAKSGGKTAAHSAWESGLRGAQFEEGSWRACVSLLAGATPADEVLTKALQQAVQQPQRRLFTLVCHDTIVATIHDLGNPKSKKPKDVPMYYEVMESAKVLLDAGEDIPCELMAYILKFQLLQVKASDQHRRLARPGSIEEVHSKAGPAPATKHKHSDSKGQKVPVPEGLAVEKQSKLKRRGKAIQSPEYRDDEPEDGPQHYVLLTGFYQAKVLEALEALGVHVDNVIKVEWECAQLHSSGLPEGPDPSVINDDLLRMAKQQGVFWSALGGVLDCGPALSELHDVAVLRYTVADLYRVPEPTLALGSHIFDGVACLIYDCLEWRSQHQNYLNHMSLITIPAVIDEGLDSSRREDTLGVLKRDVDMRYYDNLLNQLPPEACSVPLILHCMLEQVVMLHPENGEGAARPEPDPNPAGIHRDLARCMLENLLPLARTEEERRRMLDTVLTLRPGPQHSQAPQGLDPVLVEASMLQLTPMSRLMGSSAVRGTSRTADAFMQQLVSCCTSEEASSSTVEHMMHLRVLESMALTAVNQQGALVRKEPLADCKPLHSHDPTFLTEALDDREVLLIPHHLEQNKQSLLDKLDIYLGSRLRSLSEYRYAEHHDANTFPQVVQSAMQSCLCMDSLQSPLTNTRYIICHSPRGPQRHCFESWDAVLHTDVAFRKYHEHVANSLSDWLRQEEAKKEEAKKEAKQIKNQSLLETTHETHQEPHIREDSLKAWKLNQEQRQQEAEFGRKARMDSTKRGRSSNARDREATAPVGLTKEPETPSSSTTAPPIVLHLSEPPAQAFHGYRTGGQLMRVSGHTRHAFPSDGGRVMVETVSFVQGSTLIKVVVQKDGHQLFTHRLESAQTPHPDQDLPDSGLKCEVIDLKPQASFSAELKNGIRLSLRYEGPAEQVCPQKVTQDDPCPASADSPPAGCSQGLDLPACPTSAEARSRPPHSFLMSVPNGLTLQFLAEDTQECNVLVRQILHARCDGVAVAMPAELSRVISSQGTVVTHKSDGSTEVLFPDGAVSVQPPVCEAEQEEGETEAEAPPPHLGRWITTTSCGSRVSQQHRHTPPVLSVRTTDPASQAMVVTRQDRVVCVQHVDGHLTVEHKDGTRITSFCSDPSPTHTHTGQEKVPAERVVLVEKKGFASVKVFPEQGAAHVFLADGTVVTGDRCGVYQVFPSSNAGRLLIGQDGTCVYCSDPTPWNPGSQSGSYKLSTTHRVTCDITDPEGNHFQVQKSGEVSVVLSSAARTTELEEEEVGENIHTGHAEHSPRVFLVHEEGSGTELLPCEEVERLLQQAHSDPKVDLLARSNEQGQSVITMVTPVHQYPDSSMSKSRAPLFGRDPGRGLAVGGGPTVPVLQVRELVEHPLPSKSNHQTLETRLKGFREHLLRREQLSQAMTPFGVMPDGIQAFNHRTAVTLCNKSVVALKLHSDAPEESPRTERQTVSQWPQRHVKYRGELMEGRAQRSALSNTSVVPYFHPEHAYLQQKLEWRQEPDTNHMPPPSGPLPH